MTDKNEPSVYWGCEGQERFCYDNLYEAVQDFIDNEYCAPMTKEELRKAGDVVFYEIAPMKLNAKNWYGKCLANLLERIDEDYGDPENEPDEPTEKMKVVEKAFIDVVIAEYKPFMCIETGNREEVNLLKWVEENCPEDLEA